MVIINRVLFCIIIFAFWGTEATYGIQSESDRAQIIDWSVLDRCDASLQTIARIKAEANKKGITIPEEYQMRMKSLQSMISILRRGLCPSVRGLSAIQANKIRQIWKEISPDEYARYAGILRDVNSLTEFEEVIIMLGL